MSNSAKESSSLVERRREGRVLVVSMRRAAKRNAIDRAMADALDEALNELDDDDGLWAGVLTGTADVFSAGSDLTAAGDYVTERGGEYGIIRRTRRKPLVAAVEGPALGGGLEIALACDMVVAARTARFGLPEVRIGVVPTCAGLFRGPRAIPLNVARQLILTGRPIDAERAYELGFVNVLTEPGTALAEAERLAQEICETRARISAVVPRRRQHLGRRGRRARMGADRLCPGRGLLVGRCPRGGALVPREAAAGVDGPLTPYEWSGCRPSDAPAELSRSSRVVTTQRMTAPTAASTSIQPMMFQAPGSVARKANISPPSLHA